MLVDQGLELLAEDECRLLLETQQVGRVAVSIGALPAIFPVNYRMLGGDIVFRTGEGLKRRAALRNSVVGFEVDEIHPETATGWSVMVVGVAREETLEVPDDPRYSSVVTWAGGERSHLIRIVPEVVSGRRLGPPTDR